MKKIFLLIAIFTAIMIGCLIAEALLLLLSDKTLAHVLFYLAIAAFVADIVCIILGYKQTHRK